MTERDFILHRVTGAKLRRKVTTWLSIRMDTIVQISSETPIDGIGAWRGNRPREAGANIWRHLYACV